MTEVKTFVFTITLAMFYATAAITQAASTETETRGKAMDRLLDKGTQLLSKMGLRSDNSPIKTINGLQIRQLPLTTKYQEQSSMLRRCVVGKLDSAQQQKTIMVVGATGSGKSTMIDAMCNYIFGTKWTDDFRLRLISETAEERKNREKGQTMSQTEWITIYTISSRGSDNISYTLNLIDTPGFGDVRGIERDRKIVDQVKALFDHPERYDIDSIDAVCFLMKASENRLTVTQRYIFDSIMAIFSKDIGENILIMLSFADGSKALAVDSLKEAGVPYQKHFKFNNSALFSKDGNSAKDDSDEDDEFLEMFWNMGQKSFERFFQYLLQLKPKSLQLSKEVLQKRYFMKESMRFLRMKVDQGLNTMARLKREKEILNQHKQAILDNANFVVEVEKEETERVMCNSGHYVTFCMTCQSLCHDPCYIAENNKKHGCWAMTGDYCRICERKCHWTKHENTGYTYKTKKVKVKQTLAQMKAAYEKAAGKKLEGLKIIEHIQHGYESTRAEVKQRVQECKRTLKEINAIALKTDPMSEIGYIDLLIEEQKSNKNVDGWLDRVRGLEEVKREAEQMRNIDQNIDSLPDLPNDM